MTAMRKTGIAVIILAMGAAFLWAVWPVPMQVDMAVAARGPMRGVIAAQGVTRVRDPYAITAPITGSVSRSPVDVGDVVVASETVVAVIRPAAPALMDSRSRAQAEAAVAEAEAAVALAETNLRQAEAALAHAAQELERGRALAERGIIAQRMLEDLEASYDTAEQSLAAARSQLDLSRAALVRAQAQLLGPSGVQTGDEGAEECCVRLLSPVSGIVLAVPDENARLVQAGSPLVTVGNLDVMEIETDLLSADAVRVQPGVMAEVDRWGGDTVLQARVRRVDPAAFTRVSALGIEEQRVRLRLDLLTPPDQRAGLGDGFRVHVRLIVWEEGNLLQVPQAALFRKDAGWAVFVEAAGRAKLVQVTPGRQSENRVEILSGLTEGARVVLFPDSGLEDGMAIRSRADAG